MRSITKAHIVEKVVAKKQANTISVGLLLPWNILSAIIVVGIAVNPLVLITKNVYGSISAPIKRLFDRSISSVQPFFTFRNGLMRHKLKKNHIHKDLEVYLYGNSTHNEKVTLKNMLHSLCENLGATLQNIYYKPNLMKVTIWQLH